MVEEGDREPGGFTGIEAGIEFISESGTGLAHSIYQ